MRLRLAAVGAILVAHAIPAAAQAPLRKIGEIDLAVLGLSATVDPVSPVVPKNIASAVRIVIRAGAQEMAAADVARLLGAGFEVQGELSGPGLGGAVTLPQRAPSDPFPADPLLLALPPLAIAGDYELSNVRVVADGRAVLDVQPQRIRIQVIDQILVTSVKTRPLTLDEIRARGIVLDSDDYLGFEFTIGLMTESKPITMNFPVVFDRQGVPIPSALSPPVAAGRAGIPVPTIVPVLLEMEIPGDGPPGEGPRVPLTLPNGGGAFRIPSVLVIPGNVGYLKQFFSAQLFVANGAPVGSGLILSNVTGTVKLPAGEDGVVDTEDDPLALPELERDGATITQPLSMLVLQAGPDGVPATSDDVATMGPAEQGQAEFLIRGEREGFHRLDFDLRATLGGLPVGPVTVTGKASGGVLVRNPFFDVTFTLPSVVRAGEPFRAVMTVTNIGQGVANAVKVAFNAASMSGARLLSDPEQTIDTLAAGDARNVEFLFESEKTGQVVASYLDFEGTGAAGRLNFALGIGERGVPLSPDTLVLPTAVDALPEAVVDAALRVLGQAWSVANAPHGTLPRGVIRTDKTVVVKKALALAEAGLRVTLGQPEDAAMRDLAFDFFAARPLDPGLDQLLRQTEAGRALARALGAALAAPAHRAGLLAYEEDASEIAASGEDFLAVAVKGGNTLDLAVTDAAGRRTILGRSALLAATEVPGAVLLPLASPIGDAGVLGLIADPVSSPYAIEISAGGAATADASVTFPRGDGSFARAVIHGLSVGGGARARIVVDLARPDVVVVQGDADGDGAFESTSTQPALRVTSGGPRLVSANLIGPETLAGASPFGQQTAILFDRIVDEGSAAAVASYSVPRNRIVSARRQLSGRLVFALLEQPEGSYLPATFATSGVSDVRGARGPAGEVGLGVRLRDPGAVVTGRVITGDGTAVGGATVTYLNQTNYTCLDGPTHKPLAAVHTDASGSYEFRYVRQDNCGHPFRMATLDPQSAALREVAHFVRTDGENIVLDLVLFARGSVGGTVRDLAGAPYPGANVTVISVTDPQVGGAAITDGTGRYLVPGITVGSVSVRAAGGNGLGQAAGHIPGAGQTAIVNVTLDGGSVKLSGTLRQLDQGVTSTLPGVQVVYRLGGTALGVAQTDAQGRYAFDGMPIGAFTLSASVNGIAGTASGTAAANDQLTGVDILITVPPAQNWGTVTGIVRMPSGSPAVDVVVSVGMRGALTGPDGRFSIAGVAIGSTDRVLARSRDGLRQGTATVSLFIPGQVVDTAITLSGLAHGEFTVLDALGHPAADVPVRVFDGCVDPCGCAVRMTDAQGRVRFENRPVGTIAVKAIAGNPAEAIDGAATPAANGFTAFATLRFLGSGAVTGIVLDHDGRPAFGAGVALTSRVFMNDGATTCGMVPQVSHRTRTDTTGRFRFNGVAAGGISLTAEHPFYPASIGRNASLANGQTLDFSLQLVSTTAGKVTGTVYLPDGVTPVAPGVEVTAVGPLPDVTVRTTAGGAYAFAQILPEGLYLFTVRDSVTGGVAQEHLFLRSGLDASHDFRLLGKGTVRVRVVDGADVPVERALVRLSETDFPQRSFEAVIDPSNQGIATFPSLFEGRLTVQVQDTFGRGGRQSSRLPAPGDTIEVTVRLTVTGKVSGRFLMPDRTTPIPNGDVRLLVSGRVIGRVTTDASGGFAFDYVPAGNLRLEAQDPLTARTGFAAGAIASQGEAVTLDVVAQAIGSVQGVVTGSDGIVPAAQVDVVSGSFKAKSVSDSDGRYVVTGVPEGIVVVAASLGGDLHFLKGTASAVLTGEGTSLTLDVALRDSGEVTGQVQDAVGGAGRLSVVTVTVGGVGGGSESRVTDGDGRFRFERVPAGLAWLAVDVAGSIDTAASSAEVPAAGTVDVPMRLNGVGAIRGRALDSSGAPTVGSLSVTGSGAFPWARYATINADGGFFFPEQLAGPFTASLTVSGPTGTLYGKASGEIRPGEETTLDVSVEPTATVRGRVLRAGGVTAAYGTEVTLAHPRATVSLQAQEDGTFIFRGVPLGTFNLRLRDPLTGGLARVTQAAVAGNGQILDLGDIVLDDRPPSVVFVSPVAGQVRATLAGDAAFDIADVGTGLDLATLRLDTPHAGALSLGPLTVVNGRVSATLGGHAFHIGENSLRASVSDQAGNVGEGFVSFTITGGSVRGRVLRSGGAIAAGAPLDVSGRASVTSDDGTFEVKGLGPGLFFVRATDPATGLSTMKPTTLGDGEDQDLGDILLPAFGRIAGVVKHPDGSPAPAVSVTTVVGGLTRSATTAADGSYELPSIPLGQHTVSAADARNDRGDTTALVAVLGDSAQADITLNGVGDVSVAVTDAGGAVVPLAAVTLQSSSRFSSGSRHATTTAAGVATFTGVLAGVIQAQAASPLTGLGGFGQAVLLDRGSITIGVPLQPAGRVAGTVTHADGSPAPGVEITLSGTRSGSAVTDAAGGFAFENVPLGAFALSAREVATGDRGARSGVVATAGTTANGDVELNGLGAVLVRVRNSFGVPVAGANVVVQSDAPFPNNRTLPTDAAGEARFTGVLAGRITARALDGSAAGDLEAGGSLTLDVELQPVGAIQGQVVRADGETPVPGFIVTAGQHSDTTGEDGRFLLENVRLGKYVVNVTTPELRLRAQVFDVTLAQNGETKDLTIPIVGLGTVHGVVFSSGGEPVPGASVTLHVSGIFGGQFHVAAGGDGKYSILGMPVGSFTIDAAGPGGVEQVNTSGSVGYDGHDVALDLRLLASVIAVPALLSDANAFGWQVGADGRLDGGHSNVFYGAVPGAARLRLVREGVSFTFRGSGSVASTEEGRREIVIRQDDLAGLQVTRKVFVPRDGYFVRYLDILANAGSEPIEVEVREEATLLGIAGPLEPVSTSNDDDPALDAGDRWVVFDDANPKNIDDDSNQSAPIAFLFGRAGEGMPPSVSLSDPDAGNRRTLDYGWTVTVPAGGRVALLHAIAQQVDRGRGEASIDRLGHLPPELLAGLTEAEAAAVVNFAVPAGLQSAVDPLPANDGVLSGRLFAGDGVTPLASGRTKAVEFRSASAFYGRQRTVNADSQGRFVLTADPAQQRLIPREPFDLIARFYSEVGQITTAASGDLTSGSADVNVTFTGTGLLDVFTRRTDGSPMAEATLWINGGFSIGTTGAAGAYRFYALYPNYYSLLARKDFYIDLAVGRSIQTVAGQIQTLEMVFPALGRLEGTVRTAANLPVGASLRLVHGATTRFASTNTGAYSFEDLPLGTHVLQATDYRSGALVSPVAQITANTTTFLDPVFPPVGRLDVLATLSGVPLANSQVTIRAEARGGATYSLVGLTNALGHLIVENVPGVAVHVRAGHPGNPSAFGETTTSITTEAQTVPVTVIVPATSSIGGVVRSRSGQVYPNTVVRALDPVDYRVVATTTSNATGAFNFPTVPVGPVILRVKANTGCCLEFHGDVEGSAGGTPTLDALYPFGRLTFPGAVEYWQVKLRANQFAGGLAAEIPEGTTAPASGLQLSRFGPSGQPESTMEGAGLHLVVVRSTSNATGAYLLYSGRADTGVRAYTGPMVRGTVTRDTDSGPAAVRIRLRAPGRGPFPGATDLEGRFAIPLLAPGEYTLEVLDAAEDVVLRAATITAPDPLADLTQDFVVPVHQQVKVTVRVGETPLPTVSVTVRSSHPSAAELDRVRVRITGADGSFTTSMPVGSIVAEATAGTATTYTAAGTLTADAPLDLTIAIPLAPTVFRGTAYAVDGVTGVPGVSAVLFSGAGALVSETLTDGEGRYQLAPAPPGLYTLTVGGLSRTVLAAGGEQVQDFQLGSHLLRGRVSEPDGTPAAANVRACGHQWVRQWWGGVTLSPSCEQATTGPDGVYAFLNLGLIPGPAGQQGTVNAIAADGSNVGSATVPLALPFTGVATIDLTFPPSATIRGVVRATAGGPGIEGASVYLRLRPAVVADSQGRFVLRHVFGGLNTVYAESPEGLPGVATVQVDGPEEVDVEVLLWPAATLSVQLEDSGVAVARPVKVTALDAPRREGQPRWSRVVDTAEAGPVLVTVPAGLFRVVYEDETPDGPGPRPAAAEGTIAADDTRSIALDAGSHVYAAGELALATRIADDADLEPYPAVMKPELDGAALRTLTVKGATVIARRQDYTPSSGEFVRSLTLLTNPSGALVTVNVHSTLALPPTGGCWDLVATATGSLDLSSAGAYASFTEASQEARAWVIGDAVPPNWSQFFACGGEGGDADVQAYYELAIPAGGTIGFLTFSLVGPGAQDLARLQALATLRDPEALAGLTDAEKFAIINFNLPGVGPRGVVEGVGLDGGVGRGGLRAQLFDGEGNRIAEQDTDSQGRFRFEGLVNGPYQVVVFDPLTNRPGVVSGDLLSGAPLTLVAELISAEETGSVRVHGRLDPLGGPAAGATVQLTSYYSWPWATTFVLDGDGLAEVAGIPLGDYSVESGTAPDYGWQDGWLEAGATSDVTVLIGNRDIHPIIFPAAGARPELLAEGDGGLRSLECSPYCGTYGLVNDKWFVERRDAQRLQVGPDGQVREIGSGVRTMSGLEITRRTYVPADGSFVRYVDAAHNPTGDPITVTYDLVNLNYFYSMSAGTETSSGDTTFDASDRWVVVTREQDSEGSLSYATTLVAAGPGASRPPSAWQGSGSSLQYGARWNALEVGANQTVLLVSFVAVAPAADHAALAAQAEEISALTQPDVLLEGLTPAERAAIVNFVVPPQP